MIVLASVADIYDSHLSILPVPLLSFCVTTSCHHLELSIGCLTFCPMYSKCMKNLALHSSEILWDKTWIGHWFTPIPVVIRIQGSQKNPLRVHPKKFDPPNCPLEDANLNKKDRFISLSGFSEIAISTLSFPLSFRFVILIFFSRV